MYTFQLLIPEESFKARSMGHPELPAFISYDAGSHLATLTVDGWSKPVTVSAGAKVQVRFNGGLPEVVQLIPPQNPLARVAWQYGFLRKSRYAYEETLLKAAAHTRRRPAMGGEPVSPLTTHCEPGHRAVIVTYQPIDEDKPQPWGWWARWDCPPDALRSLLSSVFDSPKSEQKQK